MLADGESIAADFTPMWVGFTCPNAAFPVYRVRIDVALAISKRARSFEGRLLAVGAPYSAIPAQQHAGAPGTGESTQRAAYGARDIEIIRSWPVGYVTWRLLEMKARAGPVTAPYSAIRAQQPLGVADMPQCAVYDGNHEQRQRVRS